MKNKDSFDKNDFPFWLATFIIATTFGIIFGGYIWLMWIITKVVTG